MLQELSAAWHGAAPTTAMTHIAIVEKLDGKVFRSPTEEQTLKQLKKQKLEGKTQLMAVLDRLKKQG